MQVDILGMAQQTAWEKEYLNPKFVTKSNEPQLDFKHFLKWLKKNRKVNLDGLHVLDLGSGTGKNSLFLAERGAVVTAMEISNTAIKLAKQMTTDANLRINFLHHNIGEPYPFPEQSFDLVLDVISSNSLSEQERQIYIQEVKRVLKPGGLMFVKALCKDHDKNAQNLLKMFPGKETDTYIMPETGIIERVFSEDEIRKLYQDFQIHKLERKNSYTIFHGKPFKRNFWLVYLQI